MRNFFFFSRVLKGTLTPMPVMYTMTMSPESDVQRLRTSDKTHLRTELKPGFHYPSWRPELTAQVDRWPVSITRQHGPCWRVMETGHSSTRAVNSGRQLG